MAFEIITLNLIPDGEMPVFHASQFDTARPVIIDLVMGEDAYVVPEGITLELHCRKVDDTIVTMEPDEVTGNRVTFVTTEQLTACIGDNLCEVALLNGNDHIGTLNFILHVEPDPLAGGLTSETDIYNLTQQIEDIAEEVIGEDYYDKTEVDALLADKADVSDLPDMTDYYDKTEVDALLADKADVSDLPDMTDYYTKSQVYNKSEVNTIIDNIFPTFTASGAIASFITALNKPLVSVTTEEGATTVTRCGKNLCSTNLFTDGSVGGVSYSMDDDEKITISADSPLGPAQRIDIGEMTLPAGTYTLTGIGDINYLDLRLRTNISQGSTEFAVCNKLSPSVSFTLTESTTFYAVFIVLPNFIGTTVCEQMIRISSDADASYEAYSGQTVPVADATTLTTLSGVNNVFADVGDVTVQYKYMSM